MDLTQRTILLTGGTSGIGLALAERLLALENVVIVTGRRQALLDEARARLPALHVERSDVGRAADREALVARVVEKFPKLDVLVNNAGIQRRTGPLAVEPWAETQEEIAINLEGPIHLTSLLLPHLQRQPRAAILNVSSGLAFAPIARMALYCATKAALHSYTLSLRHLLRDSTIEVTEIIPPAVHSNLGGSHAFGVPTDEYADSVIAQLREGRPETTYGGSARMSQASRAELDAMLVNMNP